MHRHSTPAGEGRPPIAYSYIRFSTPEQLKGDSLRRQTQATAAWCERNGIPLDASLSLQDLGVSAFTGKNRTDKAALGGFLKLVERGKIPKGSYLVIENLDRLSREDERTALRLWMDILDAGINIVQLVPETIFHEKSDMFDIMRAIMELSRGHSESLVKSERVGGAWGDKKACAREGKPQPARKTNRVNGMAIMTHILPSWVEVRGGKPVLIPEKAAAVRRIFQLSAQGYGSKMTVAKLAEEGVRPISKVGYWNASYVRLILNDRRAVGEYQPKRERGRVADGPPIPNYFPAAVTEEEWLAARGQAAKRLTSPGRTGGHVNPFAGLLKCALDGSGYTCGMRPASKGRGRAMRMLSNNAGREGRGKIATFPYDTFEAAVLSCLHELAPHEILNGDSGPDEVLVLEAQWQRLDADIKAIEAELDARGESPTLYRRLRAKEAEFKEVAERRAAAQQRAANPLSSAWGEAQSLMEALGSAPDPRDARVRLRAALRRIVDSIWLLVVPSRKDRLCAVQVWFAGGKKHRDYLILHRPVLGNDHVRHESRWWARSLADVAGPGERDLRRRQDAADLARILEALDLAELQRALSVE
jgi:DNA invertase Pin-like site-specific DNA recombinase